MRYRRGEDKVGQFFRAFRYLLQKSEGLGSCIPVGQSLCASGGIIENSAFGVGIILCQGQDVVEVESWRCPWALEVFYVIPKPAFITELQRMSATDVR